jgi:hypothetical protein
MIAFLLYRKKSFIPQIKLLPTLDIRGFSQSIEYKYSLTAVFVWPSLPLMNKALTPSKENTTNRTEVEMTLSLPVVCNYRVSVTLFSFVQL